MNNKYVFSEECERVFADYIGNLFSESVKEGYDSERFVQAFLTEDMLIRMLRSEFTHYYTFSLAYTIYHLTEMFNIPKGKTYDSYVMWMYGYMLKWWAYRYPEDNFSKFTLSHFNDVFVYYHTLGWDALVDEAHSFVSTGYL